MDDPYDDVICGDVVRQRFMDKPNLRMIVSRIREQVVSGLDFFSSHLPTSYVCIAYLHQSLSAFLVFFFFLLNDLYLFYMKCS